MSNHGHPGILAFLPYVSWNITYVARKGGTHLAFTLSMRQVLQHEDWLVRFSSHPMGRFRRSG